MRTALTIAGSDSSGGAGIQADIKTMITNGVYAMSAITALTAQNTTGVQAILNVTPEFLGQELDSVFQDIYPGAVKIGMVSDKDLIHVIAEKLKQYKAAHLATVDGKPMELSFKEFELLTYFLENQGIALSREKILNSVWNYDYFGDARTIDTHVKKLRSKMGDKGEYIKTVWGMGYKFEVDE